MSEWKSKLTKRAEMGMNKVISTDALRRALTAIPEVAGRAWGAGLGPLDGYMHDSVAPLLNAPWMLDIDSVPSPVSGLLKLIDYSQVTQMKSDNCGF